MTPSTARPFAEDWNAGNFSVCLWIGLGAGALTAMFALFPTYAVILLWGTIWSVACLIDCRLSLAVLVLTIASPFFLYLDRVRSTLVVEALIAGACLIVVSGSCHIRNSVANPLAVSAFLFCSYVVANGVWAIHSGNDPWFAANELIPVVEMYVCYWLALRFRISPTAVRNLLGLTLAAVAARGAWQLLLFATGNAGSLVPPVFERAELADTVIDGASYTKLIDPIQGLGFVMALVFVLVLPASRLRRLAIVTVAVTGAVQVLSLERAEWIATLLSFAAVMYVLKSRATRAFFRTAAVLVPCAALALLVSITLKKDSLSLGEILRTRTVDFTEQQLFDPRNTLQAVRLLEFGTALDAFASSPLAGQGMGRDLRTEVFDGYSVILVPIHNYYLNLLANAGLIGVGLLGYLALRVARVLRTRYRSARSAFDRSLILGSFAALLWYAIFMAFHPVYSAFHLPAFLGCYLGLSVTCGGDRIPFPFLRSEMRCNEFHGPFHGQRQ
jgi:hypothetical protein